MSTYTGPYCDCCGTNKNVNHSYVVEGYGPGWIARWCDNCSRHVLPGNKRPWEQSYQAQHGTECPEVVAYWRRALMAGA